MNMNAIDQSFKKQPKRVGVVSASIIYFIVGMIIGLAGTDFSLLQIALRAAAIPLWGVIAGLIYVRITRNRSNLLMPFAYAGMAGKIIFSPGPLLRNFLIGLAITISAGIAWALAVRLYALDKPDRMTDDPLSDAELDGANSALL